MSMLAKFDEEATRPWRKRSRELSLPQGNTFTRSLTAKIIANVQRRAPEEIAARMWPSYRLLPEILERATSTQAMTSVAGWAADLAQKKIDDTLAALFPYSAAAELFAAGTTLTMGREGQLAVPGFSATFTPARGFVAEGQPIPVPNMEVTSPDLMLPHKLATIVVLTREMIESSNAERLVGDAAARMLGRMLDDVLIDANPGAADRPAGLRNGVATTTASTVTDLYSAFVADFGALAQAVGAVASNNVLCYIGSPGRRVKMLLWFAQQTLTPPNPDVARIYATNSLTTDLLCVASAALVSAIGDVEVEAANAASIQLDDAPTVTDIGTVAHKGMWQTDSIAIKLRWPCTWIIRDKRAVSWTTPTW